MSSQPGTIVRSHYGQHSADCYGCKLQSLTFDTGRPKTHVKAGDPWKDNPVAERIAELQAAGRRVSAFELHNPAASDQAMSAPMTPQEGAP